MARTSNAVRIYKLVLFRIELERGVHDNLRTLLSDRRITMLRFKIALAVILVGSILGLLLYIGSMV